MTGFLGGFSDECSVGLERGVWFSPSRASHHLVKFLVPFSVEACGFASVPSLDSKRRLLGSVLFCQQLSSLK